LCIHPDESFLAGIPADEVRSLYVQAAVRAGVIRPGDALTRVHYDFAVQIVTLCARLVDRYPNPEFLEDMIGDVLRGHLFDT
jgi:hypothetical protein